MWPSASDNTRLSLQGLVQNRVIVVKVRGRGGGGSCWSLKGSDSSFFFLCVSGFNFVSVLLWFVRQLCCGSPAEVSLVQIGRQVLRLEGGGGHFRGGGEAVFAWHLGPVWKEKDRKKRFYILVKLMLCVFVSVGVCVCVCACVFITAWYLFLVS